jgi:transposase
MGRGRRRDYFSSDTRLDPRPDWPQVKINPSALDPWGLPLTTTGVSGNRAEDPLYGPEIRKGQDSVGYRGVLHVGECQLASLETRAYGAGSGDLYLCPRSAVQVPQAEEGEPEKSTEGLSYPEMPRTAVEGKAIEGEEQRLGVRSLKQAEPQEKTLKGRLDKAQQAIARRAGQKMPG